jgi:hypothetical protein
MYKVCRICKDNKDLDGFHRRGDGYRTECKSCKAIIDSKRRRIPDGFYSVYYLPEHHYIGMTNCMKNRMQEHRRKGKFTNGYEVVGRFKSPIEAHYIETKLHLLGYKGFYYKGLKI